MHSSQKRVTDRERDKPWEQGYVSYMGTMKDGGKFRGYYRFG